LNWDALGAVAETLGAIAVLATLIYLAIQIRQTKELARTQTYHLAIEQMVAAAMRPEISLLFESEHRSLTEEERKQLASPLMAVLYSHEILYHLWREGQVEDALWENLWANNRHFLILEPSISLLETREGPLSAALLQHLRSSTEVRSVDP
jgi:hypothetical protein